VNLPVVMGFSIFSVIKKGNLLATSRQVKCQLSQPLKKGGVSGVHKKGTLLELYWYII